MDQLNAKLGRGTVRVLSAGPKDAAWKLRAEYRSPRWTTRWEELPRVSAKNSSSALPVYGGQESFACAAQPTNIEL